MSQEVDCSCPATACSLRPRTLGAKEAKLNQTKHWLTSSQRRHIMHQQKRLREQHAVFCTHRAAMFCSCSHSKAVQASDAVAYVAPCISLLSNRCCSPISNSTGKQRTCNNASHYKGVGHTWEGQAQDFITIKSWGPDPTGR